MATRTLEIDLRQGTGASSEPMYGVVTVQRAKAKSAGGFEILPFETSLKLINGKATITEAETDGTGPIYDSVYLFRVQNGYCAPRWGFMAALPDGSTPITTGELPMVDPITGEGIYMDAQEWNALYGDLPDRVTSLENSQSVQDGKIATLQTGKANTVHTHVIGDVTGLQSALNAKSNVGEWVPTQLNGAPINVTPLPAGLYYQTDTAATVANGYPAETFIGEIISTRISHTRALYRAYPVNWQIAGNYHYEAAFTNGVLGPWKTFTSTRVDNTAGKAIYQWDPTANREQLIYGDTGERNVSQLLTNDWELLQPAGAMLLQRVGKTVTLRLRNLDPANATNDIFLTHLPMGFRPRSGNNRIPVVAGSLNSVNNTWAMVRSYERDVRIPRTAGVIGTQYDYIEISWTTPDEWPTALPGTPA